MAKKRAATKPRPAKKKTRKRVADTEPSADPMTRSRIANARLAEERRRKIEMENEQRAGRLVDRDEVRREFTECVLRIKARLEAIPQELEMLFPPEVRTQVTRDVRDKIALILRELARMKITEDG